ncbi:MAG: hypothetical protein JRJ42_05575 [Deltaproteobacteria bacterium]|nr:hypothetical protein [Deltaproteobacteria bacterium]MBW2019610.1 hypothetical protein [Deltaproteobacteria bacterium]MBW2074425.1 hypothetical protein [Deltaproteobacteria bacterium]RLB82366.1 MAG: hypothetical protein DRH17_06040 [Deltaproteobacteria bacterium]
METITIQYCFTLPDGSQEVVHLKLDAQKLKLLDNTPETLPSWTNLDFHQCPICPLTIHTHPSCPLAVHLVNVVKPFDRLLSYEKIHVDILMEERSISQDTTVEIGVSSLMGVVMATSGCPHTAFFKPLARFHLPLESAEETMYRASSMYLLAQYFLKKDGQDVDFELKGLTKIYHNIQVLNTAIANRLRAATKTDSAINAIVLLDMYAKTLTHVISESLDELRYLFTPFLMENAHAIKDKTQQ